MSNLSNTNVAIGEPLRAKTQFREALQIALELHLTPVMLGVLEDIAGLLAQEGEKQQAMQLLTLVQRHPGSERQTLDKAERLLARLAVEVSPESGTRAEETGQVRQLEHVVTTLLEALP